MDIYIPSYKRPNAPLIRKFSAAKIPFTIVLDHEDDVARYKGLETPTTRLWLLDRALGIGYVRQCIKDRYAGRPVIMLDDDTEIRLRLFDNPTRLVSCRTNEQVVQWVNSVEKFCRENQFDIGSVADSAFKWSFTDKTLKSGSLCSVTIFNSPRCSEINYDPQLYKRMEDHDLVLQAIERHFDFLICNSVMRHCPMNKDAKAGKGGCTEVYMDDAIMHHTTNYLLNKYGADIVKLSATKKIGNCCDFRVDYKEYRKRHGYNY